MTIREFFSFKTNKFFWLNIAAMIVIVAVMVFGVLKWIDVYTHHGESVLVPDVKGMSVEEARKDVPGIMDWYVRFLIRDTLRIRLPRIVLNSSREPVRK